MVNQEKIETIPATSQYKEGDSYDFPIMPRPPINERHTNKDTGETFDTYELTAETVQKLSELGDTLVLVQTSGYWVEAVPASDLAEEFKKRGKNSADFMVLVPVQTEDTN